MKIIDKRKDYYDFLVGIYGEDPKIILDRRTDCNFEPTIGKNILYFCGDIIDIYFDGQNCYLGEDLEKFSEEVTYSKKYSKWYGDKYNKDYVTINRTRYDIESTKDDKDLNSINKCPTLVYSLGKLYRSPLLSSLNFNSYMSPENTFLKISSWLSSEIDKEFIINDNLTDTQKLENKGFDKKKSFRPNMK